MTTRIEDHPTNPDMVVIYLDYGGQNQFSYLQERALLLHVDLPTPFVGESIAKAAQ